MSIGKCLTRRKKYVQVKVKKGGGCCKIKFRLDLDVSISFGKGEEIHAEELNHSIVIKLDGKSQPFNIERFLKANKQTRPKLTLLTNLKEKSLAKLKLSKTIELSDDVDEEEENDGFLFYDLHERPEFFESQLERASINRIFSSTDNNTESSLLNVNHHIINNANDDIENIFPSLVSESFVCDLASAEKDLIDDLETENVEKSNENSYLLALKERRANRLPPEPSISSERRPIFVRHIFIGRITRYFHPKSKMMDVCNWVGSLNVEPEFLEILDYKGKVVYSADDVESGLYNMEIRPLAINMSHHGEIVFNEFGASNEMVAVENHSTSKDATSYKSFREDLLYRQGNLEIVTCPVRRDQIYNDILELYDDNKKSKKFVIYFENKEAVGEEVTRDAYTLFFERMYQSFFEGENGKFLCQL